MGGRLALHALLAAPELWRQAVIIAAHPGLHNPTARQQRRAHDQAWLRRFLNEPMTQVMPDWNAQAVFAGTSKTSFPEAFTPAMGRAFQEWSLGNQPPLWDQLPSLTTPVRWLCGERDSKFVALGNEAVALLPRGQFSQAPKCHHRVPWEWNGFGEWLVDREPQG
jgi:2-succinyl-6-hydroxy-2,4-cyclohexadiene-1-carboxylate synthase